jgi:hypothetical protein
MSEPMASTGPLAHLQLRLRRARRRAMSAALAPFVCTVDASLWVGARPGRHYWADCFRRASDYVLAHAPSSDHGIPIDGVKLVHGVCRDAHVLWAHAWAELAVPSTLSGARAGTLGTQCQPGVLVFDGVRQQFYEKEGYYRILQITAEASYSAAEILRNMRATHHYGPWHDGVLGHESMRLTQVPRGAVSEA